MDDTLHREPHPAAVRSRMRKLLLDDPAHEQEKTSHYTSLLFVLVTCLLLGNRSLGLGVLLGLVVLFSYAAMRGAMELILAHEGRKLGERSMAAFEKFERSFASVVEEVYKGKVQYDQHFLYKEPYESYSNVYYDMPENDIGSDYWKKKVRYHLLCVFGTLDSSELGRGYTYDMGIHHRNYKESGWMVFAIDIFKKENKVDKE